MPQVAAPTTSNSDAAVIETVAGLTAGIVTTLVAHPLDLLKTRLQGVPYISVSFNLESGH